MKKLICIYLLALSVVLPACKDDEYDGLLNVDPYPANAVTFPGATVNGFTLMDDNAFIINQNSLQQGNTLVVKIKGGSNKQIRSVEAKAQRFRAPITWPNVSPTVNTAAGMRIPTTFNRTIASNIPVVDFTPANEVDFTINLAALPAALTNATLGAVATPVGETPSFDVFRFFFVVTYTDDTTVVSNEVRVVVKG